MTRFRDCLLFAVLMSLISTGALAQGNTEAGTQADSKSGWFSGWSREEKALALNLGVGAAVLGWGVANWDYGAGGPRFQSEGWFDRETDEGGADKLGHFYSAICSAICSPASTNAGISIRTRQSSGAHCPPWE